MVESVESTLHRSRLKARPSSKHSHSPSMRSFQSNARHSFAASHPRLRIPRYFIVNSHESQCHHRIKESFPLPLSGKQELVGICTSEELFPRSISTHHPYHRPSKRVTHQSPLPPPPNLSLFHFRRESAWNNSGNWRGRIFGETKWS